MYYAMYIYVARGTVFDFLSTQNVDFVVPIRFFPFVISISERFTTHTLVYSTRVTVHRFRTWWRGGGIYQEYNNFLLVYQ